MLGPVAQRGERLLTIPASAQTSRALAVAVSELHAMAGWAGFEAHLDDIARHHFGRAIALSSQADDPYGAVVCDLPVRGAQRGTRPPQRRAEALPARAGAAVGCARRPPCPQPAGVAAG